MLTPAIRATPILLAFQLPSGKWYFFHESSRDLAASSNYIRNRSKRSDPEPSREIRTDRTYCRELARSLAESAQNCNRPRQDSLTNRRFREPPEFSRCPQSLRPSRPCRRH